MRKPGRGAAWTVGVGIAGMCTVTTEVHALAASDSEPAPSAAGNEYVTAAKPATGIERRLPIFGIGTDVGLPDGANLSLVARPLPWLRLQAAVGNNTISYGWRGSVCWLPFGQGPALALDYGHYAEGNANALAGKVVGPGFQPSRLLDRIGYDYVNLHLGLNFGVRRVVFFVEGGLTTVWGRVHDLDRVVADAVGTTGTTTVVLRQDPTVRATGVSAKAGLIAYAW